MFFPVNKNSQLRSFGAKGTLCLIYIKCWFLPHSHEFIYLCFEPMQAHSIIRSCSKEFHHFTILCLNNHLLLFILNLSPKSLIGCRQVLEERWYNEFLSPWFHFTGMFSLCPPPSTKWLTWNFGNTSMKVSQWTVSPSLLRTSHLL